MIEDIIIDTLTDGPMEAHELLNAIMSYDVDEDTAIDAMNRLYDLHIIHAWEDEGQTIVAIP
jgi:hypothetical protein